MEDAHGSVNGDLQVLEEQFSEMASKPLGLSVSLHGGLK